MSVVLPMTILAVTVLVLAWTGWTLARRVSCLAKTVRSMAEAIAYLRQCPLEQLRDATREQHET